MYVLLVLITGCLVLGSIQHILLSLLASAYSSSYFLLATTSVAGSVLYIVLALTMKVGLPGRCTLVELATIGVVDAGMCYAFIYSADPALTPPIFQSIFLSLTVLINAGLSKLILTKEVTYRIPYLIASIVFLCLSFGISALPMLKGNFIPRWQTAIYALAVILNSLSNVLQERYLRKTDGTLATKIGLACYTTIVQTVVVLLGSVVCLTGRCGTFDEVWADTTWVNVLLLVGFVLVCFGGFIFGTYLNEISSNYNMVLTTLTTQTVALFFAIFPTLNHGFQSPIVTTVISILASVGCVACWVYAEQCEEYKKIVKCPEYGTF